ncbi:Yae1 family protein [Paenibacillus mesophilus]|uniref:Yae1 family protein n=1 Tax=Paenibacillus mesophilus TaxID=2582849 RepID=UPI0013054419|nr:Yae1 family protein [Paenibacillus mesophilus]
MELMPAWKRWGMEEGTRSGYQAGFLLGFAKGYEEGFAIGFDKGRELGRRTAKYNLQISTKRSLAGVHRRNDRGSVGGSTEIGRTSVNTIFDSGIAHWAILLHILHRFCANNP